MIYLTHLVVYMLAIMLFGKLHFYTYIYMQSNKMHNVVVMSKFIQHFLLALHVSDLIVLLDTSSRYKVVTAGRVEQYAYYCIPNLRIQLVQNAPDVGPVRSET